MIEKSYRCNVCTDLLEPDKLYGLLWSASDGKLSYSHPFNTEAHICLDCITGVNEIYQKKNYQ